MRIETGIDIVETARIEEKCRNKHAFEKKIFTHTELAQVEGKSIRYITLAGKWAAKEAFSKALGTGISRDLDWLDMEVIKDIRNKPEIIVKKEILEKYSVDSVSLSISHTAKYAAASVIIVFNK